MNILDLIFPKRCVNCGRFGQYICATCRRLVRPIAINESICPVCERSAIDGATHPRCKSRYSLDGLTVFFHYDGPIRHAVKSLKYRHVSDLALEFVSLIPSVLLSHIQTVIGGQATLIPIPLHTARLRARGYNQAEVLGRIVALRLLMPIHTDILYRTRATVPQVATKSRKERLRNMNGVFGLKQVSIAGKTIVLFDDVFTTGATMRSAAQVLKKHGAKRVWAITMAR